MAFILPVVCLGLSCGGGEPSAESDAGKKDEPLVEIVERGPIKVTSRVANPTASVADLMTLTVTVDANKGIDVRLPEPAHVKKLQNDFIVRSACAAGPVEVADGRNRWTQTYEIEAFVSGEQTVPALEVRYKDQRPSAVSGGTPSTQPEKDWPRMETKPLRIKVTSVADKDADPTKIARIAGPVPLPTEPRGSWLWWLGGAVVLASAVVITVWLVRRRRRSIRARPAEPAHVRALRELQRIVEMQLVEQGRVEEFYFRVSGVLRQYVEDRFGLRAPERTTTEFLAELTGTDRLAPEQKDLLAQFLGHCDMVKFARYGPGDSEVQSTFDVVRHFIATTQAITEAAA